ncbi:MAG: preprotein translocase subunit SecG [Candidatus Omnitrophota bacterium]|nr:MAG: preprotein translocase subunit SecG [Candidatus Omnitrophota bacterium]
MYKFLLILHIIVAASVIGVILVQRGRSGGLVEALGGVESIFGTKTSSFFVKVTVVLAILFFVTSISVAYLAKQRGRSLIDKYQPPSGQQKEIPSETTETPPETEIPVETLSETQIPSQNDSE